jgi:hypothetical protein
MAPTVIQRSSSSKVTSRCVIASGSSKTRTAVSKNIVLVKVLPVLLLVPFKSHGSPRLGNNTVLARDATNSKAGKSATWRYGGEGRILRTPHRHRAILAIFHRVPVGLWYFPIKIDTFNPADFARNGSPMIATITTSEPTLSWNQFHQQPGFRDSKRND